MSTPEISRMLDAAVGSTTAYLEDLADPSRLAGKLRVRGAKPPPVMAPLDVRFLGYADEKRLAALRQHRGWEAWIATPQTRRPERGAERPTPTTTRAAFGLHGFLVLLRPPARRGVVVALCDLRQRDVPYADRLALVQQARVETSWRWLPWCAKLEMSASELESELLADAFSPPEGGIVLPVRTLFVTAGDKRMLPEELELHLGHIARAQGLLNEPEQERLRAAVHTWTHATTLETWKSPLMDTPPTEATITDVADRLSAKLPVTAPQPGGLARYTRTMLLRAREPAPTAAPRRSTGASPSVPLGVPGAIADPKSPAGISIDDEPVDPAVLATLF